MLLCLNQSKPVDVGSTSNENLLLSLREFNLSIKTKSLKLVSVRLAAKTNYYVHMNCTNGDNETEMFHL